MPLISLVYGTYCCSEPFVAELERRSGYRRVEESEWIAEAADACGFAAEKLSRVLTGKTSIFNAFTHEMERSVACLRLALAGQLTEEGLLLCGRMAYLVPKTVTHVLRVCLIADRKFRAEVASRERSVDAKEALRILQKDDEALAAWVKATASDPDPWSPAHHDILLPTDKTTPGAAGDLILQHLESPAVKPTDGSRRAAADFLLASRVEAALANEGHPVSVAATDGVVEITINKYVLMLSRLEDELKTIARKVPGVTEVRTRVGKDFHQADVYRRADFNLPSKILLVDDEREFAQTLSERLLMRDMGSAVAYDGESALALLEEDEPEVMILDLKMPGIDGIEVLRRVKQTRPEIEVIILTGHGTEADRATCMALGAFAYLNKPVDIEVLTETLRQAKEKMRQNLAARKST